MPPFRIEKGIAYVSAFVEKIKINREQRYHNQLLERYFQAYDAFDSRSELSRQFEEILLARLKPDHDFAELLKQSTVVFLLDSSFDQRFSRSSRSESARELLRTRQNIKLGRLKTGLVTKYQGDREAVLIVNNTAQIMPRLRKELLVSANMDGMHESAQEVTAQTNMEEIFHKARYRPTNEMLQRKVAEVLTGLFKFEE